MQIFVQPHGCIDANDGNRLQTATTATVLQSLCRATYVSQYPC